jgi:uncharacterized membrane protein YgdD (TMEM256/DUF423 family)
MTAIAVVLGAFGTHGLRGKIGYDLLEIYQTGTYYLLVHSLGMMIYGLWFNLLANTDKIKCWPALLFLVGSFIFTGSLYAITFTSIRSFGMITPIGGVLFILAWFGFANQVRTQSVKK